MADDTLEQQLQTAERELHAKERRIKELENSLHIAETSHERESKFLDKTLEENGRLDERNRLLTTLDDVSNAIFESNWFDGQAPYQAVLDAVVRNHRTLERAAILMPGRALEEGTPEEYHNKGEPVLRVVAQKGYPVSIRYTNLSIKQGHAGLAFQEEIPIHVPDTAKSKDYWHLPGDDFRGSELAVPLIREGKHGVLVLSSYIIGAFPEKVQHYVKDLAKKITLSHERVEHFTRDDVTGLYGRHRFSNDYTKYFEENEGNLGLGLVDLNSFKKVNDTFGHAVGDLYLKTVAQTIKQNLRDCDEVYRFGGDELAIIVRSQNMIGEPYDKTRDIIRNCIVNRVSDKVDEAVQELAQKRNLHCIPPKAAAIGWESKESLAAKLKLEREKGEIRDLTPDLLFREAEKNMYAHKDRVKEEQGDWSCRG